MGILWEFYGNSMGILWEFYGNPQIFSAMAMAMSIYRTLCVLVWENMLQFFLSQIHDQNSGWISAKFAMKFFKHRCPTPACL